MAWCWFNATESKPHNVKCNIFSELTLKASLLFYPLKISKNCYRKILRDNWKTNRNLSINFVLKLRCVKICCAWQTKIAWHLKTENRTLWINVMFNFFKFRKYNTAFNSGLKIWLVSGIFEMAQLLNLKFCVYLWRLGVAFSPHF